MGYNGRYVAKSTYNRQKNNQIRATKTKTKAPTKGGPIVKRQSSAITKPPSAKPTSQRIERVKVRVEPQRKLSGSRSSGALSSGQQRQLPQGKTRPQGRASAKRAMAAAKAARAAQGTKGTRVRVGETGGAANQRYGQKVVNRAVNRAVNQTRAIRAANVLGPIAAQTAGFEIANRMRKTIGKPGQSRMSKLGIQGPAKPKTKAVGTVTSQKRGMANIPSAEGYVNNPNYGKAPKKAAAKAAKTTKAATKPASKPATKPSTKPATKPSTKPETKATPKATSKTTTTKTTKTTSSKKSKLTARQKMLNRKAERLRKQAAKRTSSARDRFFARKAKTYK